MANTLKFGAGQWATKEGSTLAYNDENNNYKPLPFDFTRASSATVVNKAGLIETVGSGEPRIDFSNDAKGALLLEPQRTNLITYSEDFSNAYWSKSGSSITSNVGISLDGTNNAFKLVEDTNNSKHFISRNNLFTPDGITRNYSIFVKEGERRYIFITNVTTIDNDINCVVFDTRDGVFTNTNDTTYISNRNVTTLDNGWYRIDFSSNVNSGSYDNFYIGISSSETMSGVSYQGDGTSGIYIYGAQLEEGSYATSYIPTSGQSGGVTRVADACANAGNDQVINSTEGVLYAEISALADDLVAEGVSISDGTISNRVVIFKWTTPNSIKVRVASGGTNYFDKTVSVSDITAINKIAVKYKENDFSLFLNGVELETDISGLTPIGLDRLNLDGGTSPSGFFGNVKDVRVYNTALTDNELQALTTI